MNSETSDLRQGERFNCIRPFGASFNGWEVTLSNLSLGGVQVIHAEPVKIGLRGRLTFTSDDGAISLNAQVIWSRLSQFEGKLLYRTGLRLAAVDARFALALNSMIRNGSVLADRESLEKKRQRAAEREKQMLQSKVTPLPPQSSSR